MIESIVIKKISPSGKERKKIEKIVTNVKNEIIKISEKLGIDGDPILVGSVAKDTYLRHPEIDIFVRFDVKFSTTELEKYGLLIGKSVMKECEISYAEHPYVRGNYEGYRMDIVPCYFIEKPTQKMSSVDRTPFHTEYVKEHLKDEQKNEVRLLKQFMKGVGIYGAEAKVEGFSGYLCELLTLKYGTFSNVVRNARFWKKGKTLTLTEYKKFEHPLGFVDPVDSTRNVASAVSLQNLSTFVYACREYVSANSRLKLNFFFPKKMKSFTSMQIKRIIEKRGTSLVGIFCEIPDTVEDVYYPQLRKFKNGICKLLTEFGVIQSTFFVQDLKVIFIVELARVHLPSVKIHYGPSPWHKNVSQFTQKWANRNTLSSIYIDGNSLAVDISREYTDAIKLLQDKITTLNLGKHMNIIVAKKGVKILTNGELLRYKSALTQLLDKRFAWER